MRNGKRKRVHRFVYIYNNEKASNVVTQPHRIDKKINKKKEQRRMYQMHKMPIYQIENHMRKHYCIWHWMMMRLMMPADNRLYEQSSPSQETSTIYVSIDKYIAPAMKQIHLQIFAFFVVDIFIVYVLVYSCVNCKESIAVYI